MALKIKTTESASEAVITVTGEIDLYSSPELRTAILKAVPIAPTQVAIDLSGDRRRREAGGAGGHRLADERAHLVDLRRGRVPLGPIGSHHEATNARVPDVAGQIHAEPSLPCTLLWSWCGAAWALCRSKRT